MGRRDRGSIDRRVGHGTVAVAVAVGRRLDPLLQLGVLNSGFKADCSTGRLLLCCSG